MYFYLGFTSGRSALRITDVNLISKLGTSDARPVGTPIFLLGMPRSGATWVAKILDSHPDVLYRHEPDVQVHQHLLPYNPDIDELAELDAVAKEYISDMIGCATLGASGVLPNITEKLSEQGCAVPP